MNESVENAITGILVGGLVLGIAGGWVGLSIMLLTSWWSSWVTRADILRIAGVSSCVGIIIGAAVGLTIGFIQGASHTLIGAVTGSLCLVFWVIALAFSDSSSRSAQIRTAVRGSIYALLIGTIAGGAIGWALGVLFSVV